MIRSSTHGFRGMDQDISKSKRSPDFYFEASNIRITPTTDSTRGSVTIEKGNDVVFSITTGKTIIGATDIDKYIVLFATDNAGGDEIYRVNIEANYEVVSIFKGNLNFSTSNYITAVPSYENADLQKVFWVDGRNQLRFINILKPVSNRYPELLDVVPSFSIAQPKLESTGFGGIHTAGRIQYAYNLIIKNGQQTAISPFSPLISLKTTKKGGKVNEIVNQINNIAIEGIDTKFDIIRVYAIKYTSYNVAPVVSLIAEEEIGESNIFKYSDDGSVIYNVSLSELLFLGGIPLIPFTIESKKNRLILGNITEQYFDINQGLNPGDETYFDTRAYRFPQTSTTTTIKNNLLPTSVLSVQTVGGKDKYLITTNGVEGSIPKTHDCITPFSANLDTVGKLPTPATSHFLNEVTFPDNTVAYNFTTLPVALPEETHYIDLKLKSVDPNYPYETNISRELTPSESLNFTDTIINLTNSQIVSGGSGRTLEYGTISSIYQGAVTIYLEYNGPELDPELPQGTVTKIIPLSLASTDSFLKIYNKGTITVEGGVDVLYKKFSSVHGATGEDLEFSLRERTIADKSELLKAGEIYRFGIKFYNKYGQVSQPHWSCDLKIPEGVNLKDDDQITLDVKVKNVSKLISQGVVGYRILRVQRQDIDKTVLDQGIVSSSVYQLYDRDSIVKCLEEDLTGYNRLEPGPLPNTIDSSIKDGAIKTPSPLFRDKNDIIHYNINSIGLISSNELPEDSDRIDIDSKLNGLATDNFINQNDMFMQSKKYTDSEGEDARYDARRIQPYGEIFSTRDGRTYTKTTGDYNKSITVQNNKLMQLYSPEAVINRRDLKGIQTFNIVGKLTKGTNKSWGKKFELDTQTLREELTNYNGLNLYPLDTDNGRDLAKPKLFDELFSFLSNDPTNDPVKTYFHENGLIGPTGDNKTYIEYQYGREYRLIDYVSTNHSFLRPPVYVGTGERGIVYDPIKYKFNNDLKALVIESNQRDSKKFADGLQEDEYCQMLNGINSVGNSCYLFAEESETPLETLIGDPGEAILVEFRRTLTNQYGGNTYEARSRNSYIEIGDYQSINAANTADRTFTITRAGDIWVSTFRFARILPNLSKTFSSRFTSICEIIEVPVESSIDLLSRDDYSNEGWNSIFHPQFEDYHSYNRVYSQENTSTISTANVFTFEPVKVFSNRINASKVKTSGEIVDSWTDILINEELYLDGKYGKLVKILSTGNVDIAVQETAIAQLQIQPRVQQVTSDGLGVELGTGQVLYNYEYMTTTSGSVNPRMVFKSPSSIYYGDVYNKTINRISSEGLEGLTDSKSMHTWATKNISMSYKDSNLLHGAFDYINNDAYFIFENDICIRFNEQSGSFTDLPPLTECNLMFKSKNGLYSTSVVEGSTHQIWEHFTGSKGSYFGTVYDSYITLLVAPEPYNEVVYNNLNFISELFDTNGEDVFVDESGTVTLPLKSIRCWNNYQDSQEVSFTYKTNIFRKFRDWNVILPRDFVNKRDRLRGEWLYIKLVIDNTQNNTLILHDINLLYT